MTPGTDVDPAAFARVMRALEDRQPHTTRPDLSRMSDLVDALGMPQLGYPSIHLTGTNGKTSTARMCDSLLHAFGLRPGRYTSPHLESVAERICIDGAPLSPAGLVAAYDDVAPFVDIIDARHPERITYFELLTAMAFAAFADAPVDAGVIEVGMGGRWDATNVIDAAVSVVTPISLDHTDLLGSTVAEIAAEKAGILREGATVILGAQPLEAAEVLLRAAIEVGTTVAREGLEFGVLNRAVAVGGQMVTFQGLTGVYDDVFLPLVGEHQAHNAACALAAVEALLIHEGEDLSLEIVREAFAAVRSPGRLEVARRSPTTLLDGAHNPAGAAALAEAVEEAFSFDRLVGVIGMLGDKDAAGVLSQLEPLLDAVVVTQSSSPRALPAHELAAIAREVMGDDRVTVEPHLPDALDAAMALAEQDLHVGRGGVLVTGSLVTVGEARALLVRR